MVSSKPAGKELQGFLLSGRGLFCRVAEPSIGDELLLHSNCEGAHVSDGRFNLSLTPSLVFASIVSPGKEILQQDVEEALPRVGALNDLRAN